MNEQVLGLVRAKQETQNTAHDKIARDKCTHGILHEYRGIEFSGIHIIEAGNDMEVTGYNFCTFTHIIHHSRMDSKFNLGALRGQNETNPGTRQWLCQMRKDR